VLRQKIITTTISHEDLRSQDRKGTRILGPNGILRGFAGLFMCSINN